MSGASEWRVRHEGRDSMFYEELHQGAWRRLDINAEMLVGRAHYGIHFGSRVSWSDKPEWARGRREEIIARIKNACPIPDYEYSGEGVLDDRDLELLIHAAGGLSADHCAWAGCPNLALKSMSLCVVHANWSAV
jgi:hypothetical protein